MRVVVTGAGGMLGQDVLHAAGDGALGLARADLDVTDAGAVRDALADAELVVNCAAYTDVDGAESEPDAALRVNGEGAGNVAAAAAAGGAAVIHLSTDYVFDGTKEGAYLESDPTRPLQEYGRSKLAGEEAVVRANPRHHIVRSSWLFGAGGANFVDTMLRVARERGEARVVDDQVGCPTFTGHLARGLLALADDDDYGVRHMAGAGSCSWYEFAREIFTRAGVRCELSPCATSEFPRPARRPANSVLRSERPGPRLPAWQEGLAAYLKVRA
jgi:dTDP-4-dehydrorhamnose reductase